MNKKEHWYIIVIIITLIMLILAVFVRSCEEEKPVQPQPTATSTTPSSSTTTIMAWIYPGKDVCDVPAQYSDGRKIDILKPQYYTLQDNGSLLQNTVANSGCNGYSAANAADVKAHSQQQYVTISGETAGMDALANNKALQTTFLNTVTSFLTSSGFTGVEIDFEGFAAWTPQQYNDYKTLVATIGNALHGEGYKLMIDGPAISDPSYQGYYPNWKWSDFNQLPVDVLVAMAYDQNLDNGTGTPVASLDWIAKVCAWMKAEIKDQSRITIGINSYGYHGIYGSYSAIQDTYNQSKSYPGFNTATRDAESGEMMWKNGNTFYDYSDSTATQGKLNAVLSTGITSVSVWSLGGGNQWFQSAPVPAPTPQPTPTPTPTPPIPVPSPSVTISLSPAQINALVALIDAFAPGFATWYSNNNKVSED